MNNNLQPNFQEDKSLMVSSNIPKWLSWQWIILAWILFWPVGMFFIWKRCGVDKKTALRAGKVVSIVGWVFVAFAAMMTLGCIAEGLKNDDIGVILFFWVVGLALVIFGKRTKNNVKKYKKYISIIVNDGITNIARIAEAFPASYGCVQKDLQKMINQGFFQGAYINDGQIVLPRNSKQTHYNEANSSQGDTGMKVVVCKGCGAQNSIAAGSVGECEFCGSKIEGR